MSSLVYPGPSLMPGLAWSRRRNYVWSTNVQQAVSGKESRISYQQYPRVRFRLKYELLRDNVSPSDLRRLVGLFNALRGRFDTCLFVDPDFSSVTSENFGTGTGAQTAFQITATFQNSGGPGAAELIQNFDGAPLIYVNGVLKTGGGVDYTLGANGVITFTAAPANGAALTWTGSFYYRVRFDDDELDVEQFMNRWWQSGEVSLISVKF